MHLSGHDAVVPPLQGTSTNYMKRKNHKPCEVKTIQVPSTSFVVLYHMKEEQKNTQGKELDDILKNDLLKLN
jgi:hypothetical protein